MENQGDVAMEKKLDQRDYNDDELISIKTTLHLPYYTSSASFERVYGSINLNGVVYEYVKRRVFNDTLELLCLPNAAKTKLQTLRNELTKATADGQASAPVKKGTSVIKLSLPDFFQPQEVDATATAPVQDRPVLRNDVFSQDDFSARQERPPQPGSFFS